MSKFKILWIQFIVLMLSACVSSPATPVAPVTPLTSPVALSETPTKAQATETPTVAPAPTEVPVGGVDQQHPEAGPRPEGAVDIKNIDGTWMWTKEKSGYQYFYDRISLQDNKEVYQGWFRSMTPIKIPFMEYPGFLPDGQGGWVDGKDISPITILVEEDVPGSDAIQFFTHMALDPIQATKNAYVTAMYTNLANNENDLWQQIISGLEDGTRKYSVQFGTTSYGWYPSPDHGVKVYLLSYDNPAVTEENGFLRWNDAPYNHFFKGMFWGLDSQGNAVGALASEVPLDQLDPHERLIFPFYHISCMFTADGEDITLHVGGFNLLLQHLMQDSERSDPPYIEVTTQTP